MKTLTYTVPNGNIKTMAFYGMLSDFAKMNTLKKEGRFINLT